MSSVLKATIENMTISVTTHVATHLQCGEIFRDSIIAHFLLILAVK